jgi:hypothetical protein
VQRHERGLHREDAEQEQGTGAQQRDIAFRDLRNLDRKVRHIERAGHAIDQADREQKHGRGDQIDRHILEARLEPVLPASMQREPVGRDQQHFEEDEQVEDVAGQERAIDAEQLKLKERMEMPPLLVPARRRVKHGAERQRRGDQQHRGRQPVEHQHNAERGRPVAEKIRLRLAVGRTDIKPDGDEKSAAVTPIDTMRCRPRWWRSTTTRKQAVSAGSITGMTIQWFMTKPALCARFAAAGDAAC